MFKIYHAFSSILVIFEKYVSPCKILNYADINIINITTEYIRTLLNLTKNNIFITYTTGTVIVKTLKYNF